jgi:hypothetical protein
MRSARYPVLLAATLILFHACDATGFNPPVGVAENIPLWVIRMPAEVGQQVISYDSAFSEQAGQVRIAALVGQNADSAGPYTSMKLLYLYGQPFAASYPVVEVADVLTAPIPQDNRWMEYGDDAGAIVSRVSGVGPRLQQIWVWEKVAGRNLFTEPRRLDTPAILAPFTGLGAFQGTAITADGCAYILFMRLGQNCEIEPHCGNGDLTKPFISGFRFPDVNEKGRKTEFCPSLFMGIASEGTGSGPPESWVLRSCDRFQTLDGAFKAFHPPHDDPNAWQGEVPIADISAGPDGTLYVATTVITSGPPEGKSRLFLFRSRDRSER